jgi:hypothetical protein
MSNLKSLIGIDSTFGLALRMQINAPALIPNQSLLAKASMLATITSVGFTAFWLWKHYRYNNKYLRVFQGELELEVEEEVFVNFDENSCESSSSSDDDTNSEVETSTSSTSHDGPTWRVIPGRYHINVAHRVKNKFGTPKYTLVNHRAVRDYASKIMASDGHRPSHITRDLPRIVNLVFTPTKLEVKELERFKYYGPANANQKYYQELPNGN